MALQTTHQKSFASHELSLALWKTWRGGTGRATPFVYYAVYHRRLCIPICPLALRITGGAHYSKSNTMSSDSRSPFFTISAIPANWSWLSLWSLTSNCSPSVQLRLFACKWTTATCLLMVLTVCFRRCGFVFIVLRSWPLNSALQMRVTVSIFGIVCSRINTSKTNLMWLCGEVDSMAYRSGPIGEDASYGRLSLMRYMSHGCVSILKQSWSNTRHGIPENVCKQNLD